jgi:hypothetical protein
MSVVCGLMTYAYRRKTRSSARASITTQHPAHVVRAESVQVAGECFRHPAGHLADDPNGDLSLYRLRSLLLLRSGSAIEEKLVAALEARPHAFGSSVLARLPEGAQWRRGRRGSAGIIGAGRL